MSAMDDVCALHHVSTSSLLALGYIVMYKYIYAYIHMCMYIYIVYVLYTTMHGNMYIYTHNYILYIQLSIGCGMCWRTSNGQGEKRNNKWTALAGFEPVTICLPPLSAEEMTYSDSTNNCSLYSWQG